MRTSLEKPRSSTRFKDAEEAEAKQNLEIVFRLLIDKLDVIFDNENSNFVPKSYIR